MAKWKVRSTDEQGDLVESEFTGSLAQLLKVIDTKTVMAIVRVAEPPAAGSADAARGSDAVSVDKG